MGLPHHILARRRTRALGVMALLWAGCAGSPTVELSVFVEAKCPRASYMREGVLTSDEGLEIVTNGVLTLRSLSVQEITTRGGGIYLTGEVYNGTSETRCIPSADMTIDGITTYGVIAGPPYSGSGLTYVCLGPGESGGLHDIERGVDGFAPNPSLISVDFTSFPAAGETSVEDHLLTTGSVERSGRHYYITGSAEATAPVNSILLDFFGRNDLGLLEPPLAASRLEELAVGDRFDFTTGTLSCPITSFVSYAGFVDHAATVLAPSFVSSPREVAVREARRRREALRQRTEALLGR